MKIAVIGASGNAGSRITVELARRGHAVTAIARHANAIAVQAGVTPIQADIADRASLAAAVAGHDVVVHSVHFLVTNLPNVVAALKTASVKRLLVVGGAGSLQVAPGVDLVDTPEFPPIYKAESLAGREFLSALRNEHDLDWTFISPSAFFAPGERTGKFRLGTDTLLVAKNGESSISMEDFAIALVDEIETPKHVRARFTVGY
ncbi:MAG TPA: NAD(P)-dependent oxidoreductase [Capsulimonadaceae bacterium]|jgi:hypothetical protein